MFRIDKLTQKAQEALQQTQSLAESNESQVMYPIHLLAALEVKLIGVELHPVRVIDRFAGLDAEQYVVRAGIVLLHVMAVIGRGNANTRALSDPKHVRNDLSLFFQTMIVNLQKETILAEDVLIFRSRLFGLFDPAGKHIRGDFAIQAGRQSD